MQTEQPADGAPLEPTVRRALTRRQRELLRFVESGGKVYADYQGGPVSDLDNWDFAAWRDEGADGCPRAARELLRLQLVRIAEPDQLNRRFLAPNVRAERLAEGESAPPARG